MVRDAESGDREQQGARRAKAQNPSAQALWRRGPRLVTNAPPELASERGPRHRARSLEHPRHVAELGVLARVVSEDVAQVVVH
jgi:hypothetical protein